MNSSYRAFRDSLKNGNQPWRKRGVPDSSLREYTISLPARPIAYSTRVRSEVPVVGSAAPTKGAIPASSSVSQPAQKAFTTLTSTKKKNSAQNKGAFSNKNTNGSLLGTPAPARSRKLKSPPITADGFCAPSNVVDIQGAGTNRSPTNRV